MRRAAALLHAAPPLPPSSSSSAFGALTHFSELAQLLGNKHATNETWWMLEHVTGKQRYEKLRYGIGGAAARAPASLSSALSAAEMERLSSMVHARAVLREPLQYLLGSVDFLGLPLQTRAPILIPRPETESMVGWILRRWQQRDYTRSYKHLSVTHETDFREVMQWFTASKHTTTAAAVEAAAATAAAPHSAHMAAGDTPSAAAPASSSVSGPPLRLLDLCTGSGNIALALAHHMPHPSVRAVGIDINPRAVQLSRDNLAHLQQLGFLRSNATRTVSCTFAEVDLLQTKEQQPIDAMTAALETLFPSPNSSAQFQPDPLLHSLLHPPACMAELLRLARDQSGEGAAASPAASPAPSPVPPASRGILSSSTEGGPYHLLVSNPPYIPLVEHASLQREVRDWEDFHALVAADEGMQLYKQILRALPSLLRPSSNSAVGSGGSGTHVGSVRPSTSSSDLDPSAWDVPEVVLEIGSALQAMELAQMLQAIGFQHVTIHHDIADLPRWIAARRSPVVQPEDAQAAP